MTTAEQQVVVAEVVRSGFVESRHRGSVVAVDPAGQPLLDVGDTSSAVFLRSCNKLVQATGMVRLGLDLPPDLLALACASHSGEPFHLDGVRRLLAGAGLDESALRNAPGWPLDEAARDEQVRAGLGSSALAGNCSGKHAAMLTTCVLRGWDTATYAEPEHPLQRALAATFAELTGQPGGADAVRVGVDGCGAPLFAASLRGLAGAFGRLATAPAGSAEAAVAAAVRAHPEHVSGTRRDEARLLRALPGAIGKAGAEACYAVALADGTAVALKIDDGGARARPVLMAAVLRRLGLDDPVLDDLASGPVLGGGRVEGEVRAVLP